jgi:hypothetical protein
MEHGWLGGMDSLLGYELLLDALGVNLFLEARLRSALV